MTDYICYGCNENCIYDEYALRTPGFTSRES